jgi:hypothetical protein
LLLALLVVVYRSEAKSTADLFCACDWASNVNVETDELHLAIIAGGQGPNCTNTTSLNDATAGAPRASGVMLDTVNVYDTNSKTWKLLHLPSGARSYLAAASAGNKAYFAGGEIRTPKGTFSFDGIDVYDFKASVWSKAKLSVPRKKLAAVSVGNLILFAGGFDDTTGTNFSTRVDILNSDTGVWSTAEMKTPRMYFAAVAVDGVAVLGGGQQTAFTNGESQVHSPLINTAAYDMYDSHTSTWSNGMLPSGHPRDKLAATWARNAKKEGLLLFVGAGTVDVYNVHTKQWTNHSDIVNRGGNLAAATIGNGRYALFMGGTGAVRNACAVYDAVDELWFLAQNMSVGRSYLNAAGTSEAAVVGGGEGPGGILSAVDIYTVADMQKAKLAWLAARANKAQTPAQTR